MKTLSLLPDVSHLWVLYLFVSILGYLIIVGIYRLYFHPLSSFPGPKLAKLTSYYEFYYDVILDSQFHVQVGKIHDKYGPIVRIRPDEIHIKDSEFYDTLFSRTAKRDKHTVQTLRLGSTKDAFSTAPHDLHRSRRKALNPFFSPQKIQDFQGVIREKVNDLCSVISQYKNGKVLNSDRMWIALTTDVISQFAFAKSMGHLESPDFQESFIESTAILGRAMTVGAHFPWFMPALSWIPNSVVKMMQPDLQVAVGFQDKMLKQITEIRAGKQDFHSVSHSTIFRELIDSPLLPESEKSDQRLADEAMVVISAGLSTTAGALIGATFHLTRNPLILNRMLQELKDAGIYSTDGNLDPTKLDRNMLEQLPYLNGVVHESIRSVGAGVGVRMTRLAPDQELVYKDWVIPRNTPVSMSNIDVLFDEKIFPDPLEFRPQRWFGEEGKEIEKRGWVPFGRGPRSCLGMGLAYSEIYIGLVTVFSRFRFELFETDEEDIRVAHFTQVPYPKRSSKGVRVLVFDA